MAGALAATERQKQQLVFRLGAKKHALATDAILEVLRVPRLTRVPGAPRVLAGLANLRGRPLPVISVERLLHGEDTEIRPGGRIIVYDRNGPIGLLVDDVLSLSDGGATASVSTDDLHRQIDGAFQASRRPASSGGMRNAEPVETNVAIALETFLSFRVGGQLYGLPLASLREVAVFESDPTRLADAKDSVLGVMASRDSVLPLVSLAALLGLSDVSRNAGQHHVVVVVHQGTAVGLVVDAIDALHRLPQAAIDPVPSFLQHDDHEAQIVGIARLAERGRLMSVLSTERLWGHASIGQALQQTNSGTTVMESLPEEGLPRERGPEESGPEERPEKRQRLEQFLIFRLGDERYGLPIASVDEVIRVPELVTRLPNAPAFVSGVINLRGRPLPLVDQRLRFETSPSGRTTSPRAIVLTVGALQAGFIVDEVSEVVSLPATALSQAPDFATDDPEVFDRVAHLEAGGGMILLIDPKQLLSKAERDLMASIADDTAAGAP